METLFNIGIVLLCLAASMGINRVFVCFNFYNHIDFSGKRYLHIDGIRGIAALLVVLNHAVFSLSNNGFNPLSVNTSNFWVFAHAGDIGVQIFFCITGFLFFDKIIKTGNKINWEMFFVSRVKRLVPM
ncbi:TPA: acyltransferase family protein, partial [Escherichia coli]